MMSATSWGSLLLQRRVREDLRTPQIPLNPPFPKGEAPLGSPRYFRIRVSFNPKIARLFSSIADARLRFPCRMVPVSTRESRNRRPQPAIRSSRSRPMCAVQQRFCLQNHPAGVISRERPFRRRPCGRSPGEGRASGAGSPEDENRTVDRKQRRAHVWRQRAV